MATKLSRRELQIIALVKQAKRNKEISHELHLAEGTIKEYMFHLFRKLGITSRVELAMMQFDPRD